VLDSFVLENEKEILDAIRERTVLGILFHYCGTVRTVDTSARAVSQRWLFLQRWPTKADEDLLEIIRRFQRLVF
jgi:hypothetical protein